MLSRVQRRDQEECDTEDVFEDIQVCELCKQVGDENMLLLCDGMNSTCNAAFHCSCVGLDAIPHGSWFCPDCKERGFDTSSQTEERTVRSPQARDADQAAVQPDVATTQQVTVPSSSSAVACTDACDVANLSSAATSQTTSIGGGSGHLPSQFRLSAIACVSPAVAVPKFQSGVGRYGAGSGSAGSDTGNPVGAPTGIFASFARRRRMQGGDGGSAAVGNFISLQPTYEDDFMGRVVK